MLLFSKHESKLINPWLKIQIFQNFLRQKQWTLMAFNEFKTKKPADGFGFSFIDGLCVARKNMNINSVISAIN